MRSTDVAPAVEVWLRRQLHDYALVVRQLAYSLPNAAGERDLLQLSEQMNATANQGLAERFAALPPPDPGAVDMLGEPDDGAIEQIRAVIPDWPDTDGTPWQLCAGCRVVYDPGTADAHVHRSAGRKRRKARSLDVVPQALEVVVERFDVDVAAAAALLQKLSTATNTSVEHVARWLARAGQPAGRPAAGHHT